jgi:Acetoacetate decarboxylase (ADC)
MLSGFVPPYTPSGRSSLIPPPPWHYAGQVFSLAFKVDADRGQCLLPDGFGRATGGAAGHFCEWQWTSDGSELLDPVYAQYKEFVALIEAERNGERALYCPFIYVDQDLSMIRGLLQGVPKKCGSIWMTRSYEIDHPAAARLRTGCRIGATLAVKDRRLAEATIELSGAPSEPLGFLAFPTYGLLGAPTLIGKPDAGTKQLVRTVVSAKMLGPAHAGRGSLRLFESPRDEISLLTPITVTAASVCTFAFTLVGAAQA